MGSKKPRKGHVGAAVPPAQQTIAEQRGGIGRKVAASVKLGEFIKAGGCPHRISRYVEKDGKYVQEMFGCRLHKDQHTTTRRGGEDRIIHEAKDGYKWT
jgi:hypothetical protein